MNPSNNQCENCQLLEKKILDEHVTLKKLLSLKSKIFHTDALIRKFKEQKDENLRLTSECEKAQSFCAKYEIDLKLALEELHTLKSSEKELKDGSSKLQSEISGLKENLEAEKALVKQYKCLIDRDDKPEHQLKEKAFKDLEKKLSKKDDDLCKSREKVRNVNKKLNFVYRSHFRVLRFLRKIGSHPALQGVLPTVDKKTLEKFNDVLQNENSFRTRSVDASDEEFIEFDDESRQLENLLQDVVPDESSEDTDISSQVSSPAPPTTNSGQSTPSRNNLTDSMSNVENGESSVEKRTGNDDVGDNDEASRNNLTDLTSNIENSESSSEKRTGNDEDNDEDWQDVVAESGDTDKMQLDTVSLPTDMHTNVYPTTSISKNEENDNVKPPEMSDMPFSDKEVTDICESNELATLTSDETNCSGKDISEEQENTSDCAANDTSEVQNKNSDCPTEDTTVELVMEINREKNEVEKVSSLPLIPFSEERQFQPGKGNTTNTIDPSLLFRDTSETTTKVINESTLTEKSAASSKDCEKKKTKKSVKHVSKIFSRMKYTSLVERPVSPLPPSPPPVLSSKDTFPLGCSDSASSGKPKPPKLLELFGSDSEGESGSKVSGKYELQHQQSEGFDPEFYASSLQHQESEGFDPELETQDSAQNEGHGKQDLGLSKNGRFQNQLQPYSKCPSNEGTCRRQGSNEGHSEQNTQRNSNTRLFTDVTMDKQTGRCKISIRLPDNLDSVSNVKLELDTFTRELHLDYGPSRFTNNTNPSQALMRPVQENHLRYEGSSPPSPTLSLMEDSINDVCNEQTNHISSINNSMIRKQTRPSKALPAASVGPVRRASAPAARHALHRLAMERKTVTFANHINKTRSSELITKDNACPQLPASEPDVFKTPASRIRKSLVSQPAFNESRLESSVSSDTETNLKPESSVGDSTKECLATTTSNAQPGTASCKKKRLKERSAEENTSKKRKLENLHFRNEDVSVKFSEPLTLMTADSLAVRQAKIFHNTLECQPKINTRVLKALKRLEELQGNDDNDSVVIFHLISEFCNPNLIKSQDELVDSAILYFSRCKVEVLPKFVCREQHNKPLLTLREECFVSLVKRLQDRKSSMTNLLEHFRTSISSHLSTAAGSVTGCACLCRLHSSFSRLEGNLQAPRGLCYNLLLKKHPHAAYLVANLVIVWPAVLTLDDQVGAQKCWRDVLSFVLFNNTTTEGQTQGDLTRQVLTKMGNLLPAGSDTDRNSLTKRLLDLLKNLQGDSRETESLCQQILLLCCHQDWTSVKASVLPTLFDYLDSGTNDSRAATIKILGYILQMLEPKQKDETDLLVNKLLTTFKKLDDTDASSKAACVHSLLNRFSHLDSENVSSMKHLAA